jgi:putative colanic acid biosynthesis acetyltransferase WcaF
VVLSLGTGRLRYASFPIIANSWWVRRSALISSENASSNVPTLQIVLNIPQNRSEKKWTLQENVCRVLWALVHPLFRFSPRPLWGYRRALLRLFGATIDNEARIHPTVKIAMPWNLEVGSEAAIGDRVVIYNLGHVRIGPQATVSQGVHLCAGTHNYRLLHLPLVKSPISIGKGVWLCADAFIGPGVSIGEYAVVAARGVVMKDVEGWHIVAGNPAVFTKLRPPPAER